MANEATCLSLTTTEMATDVADKIVPDDVDVATTNAGSVTASTDVALYFLKAAYEGGSGRNKLLRHLEKIKASIMRRPWPAI